MYVPYVEYSTAILNPFDKKKMLSLFTLSLKSITPLEVFVSLVCIVGI